MELPHLTPSDFEKFALELSKLEKIDSITDFIEEWFDLYKEKHDMFLNLSRNAFEHDFTTN